MTVLRDMAADLSHLGRHGAPPVTVALLTRTVANAASTSVYRELLQEEGWTVLRSTVARLERYGQAFGGPVEHALDSSYGDALLELQGVTV